MMDSRTCAGKTNGSSCHRDLVITSPVELCNTHRIEVALGVLPGLLLEAMKAHETEFAAPEASEVDSERIDFTSLPIGTHEPVVYFISNGGRVKIGYSTNLHSRVLSLSLRQENVLSVFRGGPDLERSLHAKFQAHRVGNTEWFDASHEILTYASAGPIPTVRTSGSAGVIGTSLADLAREQIAITEDNRVAVARILDALPTANKESVAAAVRRARKSAEGPYL